MERRVHNLGERGNFQISPPWVRKTRNPTPSIFVRKVEGGNSLHGGELEEKKKRGEGGGAEVEFSPAGNVNCRKT